MRGRSLNPMNPPAPHRFRLLHCFHVESPRHLFGTFSDHAYCPASLCRCHAPRRRNRDPFFLSRHCRTSLPDLTDPLQIGGALCGESGFEGIGEQCTGRFVVAGNICRHAAFPATASFHFNLYSVATCSQVRRRRQCQRQADAAKHRTRQPPAALSTSGKAVLPIPANNYGAGIDAADHLAHALQHTRPASGF